MKLDLQYFHVIVFMFLIAYLDAYFFLIMFFFWADNENDEDEFDEAADDLHFEILQFMIRTKAIDLKGAQFDKTKFMLNEFEFLGGV